MKRSLPIALAITLAACGASSRPHAEQPDDDGVFVNKAGFEPTAFTVKVHGKGPAVILIPGLGCPGEMWDSVVDHLGDRYESHVLTLAGFAGTEPIKPPLAAKTRKELIRYIRSRHLVDPIIVGHSMGGFITYWLGATAQDAIGGIVVVDAGPRLGSDDDETARLLRNAWAQAGDDELPKQVRAAFSSMTRHPARMEPYLAQIAKSDRQTIGDAIYEMAKTDVSDKLDAIEDPMLLILADGGLQNRFKRMAEDVPDHEVVVIPNTGHFVWFDDPDGFNRTLDKFLAAHAGR